MTPDVHTMLINLPAEWPHDVLSLIRAHHKKHPGSIVVLDDDPTGCQTVYDIPVLTEWSREVIEAEFRNGTCLFYILTNSRALQPEKAKELAAEIGANLKNAAKVTGRAFHVISRSDSTLRGHYPLEVDALVDALEWEKPVHIICPFFLQGGRYTIKDVHYVEEAGRLVPAAETPFAGDASFGFSNSNMCQWVEEKTNGRVNAAHVHTLSIPDIRQNGPEHVLQHMQNFNPGDVCVLNAASIQDVRVAALALLRAEKQGKRFIFRTAASFVQAYAGLDKKPLLRRDNLDIPGKGAGLVIVGSYVPKSTAQLHHLRTHMKHNSIEISAAKLAMDERGTEIQRVIHQANAALKKDKLLVLYTSRALVTGRTSTESLDIVARVSSGLVNIVRGLSVSPKFVIAKGGITASDIATKGFGVKRAWVKGQILPGVPVWKFGKETTIPNTPYIVFPGNVGDESALFRVAQTLQDKS